MSLTLTRKRERETEKDRDREKDRARQRDRETERSESESESESSPEAKSRRHPLVAEYQVLQFFTATKSFPYAQAHASQDIRILQVFLSKGIL